MAQRAVEDFAAFQLPARADRGGGEVGDAEVGDVVVQRAAVRIEQLAELSVGHEVIAVSEGGETERVPGPGGYAPALRRIDAGQGAGRAGAGCGRVCAHGQDGGDGHVGGRRHDIHLVRLGQVAGLGADGQGVVPAAGVDVGPPERGQRRAAGAANARGLKPVHGFLE